VFGIDSMAEAAHAAVRLGALRPLLVTDPGLIEAGWTDEMISHLRALRRRQTVERADPETPRTTRSPPGTSATAPTAAMC
jgi:alcohol dehydrogenase class IV